MAAEHHNDMQCNEFDALLSDAIDKMLTGPKAEAFLALPFGREAIALRHWPRDCGVAGWGEASAL